MTRVLRLMAVLVVGGTPKGLESLSEVKYFHKCFGNIILYYIIIILLQYELLIQKNILRLILYFGFSSKKMLGRWSLKINLSQQIKNVHCVIGIRFFVNSATVGISATSTV